MGTLKKGVFLSSTRLCVWGREGVDVGGIEERSTALKPKSRWLALVCNVY